MFSSLRDCKLSLHLYVKTEHAQISSCIGTTNLLLISLGKGLFYSCEIERNYIRFQRVNPDWGVCLHFYPVLTPKPCFNRTIRLHVNLTTVSHLVTEYDSHQMSYYCKCCLWTFGFGGKKYHYSLIFLKVILLYLLPSENSHLSH